MARSTKAKKLSLNLTDPRYKVGAEIVGPVTPPPMRYKKSADIQKKLLDTAEFLFARWGYAAVSIRDVTSLAGMRVANVSYYFGSKQTSILKCCAVALNRCRRCGLSESGRRGRRRRTASKSLRRWWRLTQTRRSN
jgi:AcrR family transcriptional regulator